MTFDDVPVIINGVTILATSASLEENYPIGAVKSLGVAGNFTGFASAERQKGTVTLSYYLQDGDSYIRSLTGINLITGCIGPILFKSGILNSYSLSAQPFELIEVSAGFDFYNGIEEYSDTGIYDPQDFSILNGRFSSGIDNVGFNNKLLNYSYSIQQSVEPIYVLSESYPSGYSRSNGQITISVQGTGIADAVDFPCADLVTSSITLGSTCGESFTISTTGLKPEKVSIQAQVGAQMVGSVDLIKFF